MSAGPTAERVYEALAGRILAGEFRPGEHLEPAMLAETLASSVTPVREALHVLTGEGLVEARSGGGFHVRSLDAVGLADLYEWAADVAAILLKHGTGALPRGASEIARPQTIAALFTAVAAMTANAEHADMAKQLNARLAVPRLAEGRLFADVDIELRLLITLLDGGDTAGLRRELKRYHQKRIRAATEIVRAVIRD